MTKDRSGLTKHYTVQINQDSVEAVIAMIKERLGPPRPDDPLDEDDLFRQFLTNVLNAELFSGEVLRRMEIKWRGYRREPSGYPLRVHFIVRDSGGDVMCGQNIIGELHAARMDCQAFDPVVHRAVPPEMRQDEFDSLDSLHDGG